MIPSTIRDRINSICASEPFGWVEAQTPFSFELTPKGSMRDGAFRTEIEGGPIIGGFNFTETRTDRVHIWIAKPYKGDPRVAYSTLHVECNSLRAAVIRDGHANGGDYTVPSDGAELQLQREAGKDHAVGRLTIPVNYETTV